MQWIPNTNMSTTALMTITMPMAQVPVQQQLFAPTSNTTAYLNYQPQCLPNQCQQLVAACYSAMNQRQVAIPEHKNLVIFDWDNTLIPTTAFFDSNLQVRRSIPGAELTKFGKALHSVIRQFAAVFGAENVFIVTNGSGDWIMRSLRRLSRREQALSGTNHWSQIQRFLSYKMGGRVLSARALHEKDHEDPTMWKIVTFRQIAIDHFGGNNKRECSIISIGDSDDEFVASSETKKYLQIQHGFNAVNLIRLPLTRRPSSDLMLLQFTKLIAVSTQLGANGTSRRCSFDLKVADFIKKSETKKSKGSHSGSTLSVSAKEFTPSNTSI